MSKPVARVYYKTKGNQGLKVGSLWKGEFPDGSPSFTLSLEAEDTDYGSAFTQEMLEKLLDKKAFLNVYFPDEVTLSVDDDPFS